MERFDYSDQWKSTKFPHPRSSDLVVVNDEREINGRSVASIRERIILTIGLLQQLVT